MLNLFFALSLAAELSAADSLASVQPPAADSLTSVAVPVDSAVIATAISVAPSVAPAKPELIVHASARSSPIQMDGVLSESAWADAQDASAEPTFARNGLGTLATRVPTLRNIERTGPYMHDGRFSTLDAVLAHYEQAGLRADTTNEEQQPALHPFTLNATERLQLIAFLHSLTDPTFMAGFDGERKNSVSRR